MENLIENEVEIFALKFHIHRAIGAYMIAFLKLLTLFEVF